MGGGGSLLLALGCQGVMPQLVGQLKGNDLIKNKKIVVSGRLIKIGVFVLVRKHQV